MNTERLKILRETISLIPDDEFDMSTFCGSACCIGGKAIALWGEPSDPNLPFAAAARILDLSVDQAHNLFLDQFAPFELFKLTRQEGLHALDTFIATGVAEWPKYFR